jgi:hypothetical protein
MKFGKLCILTALALGSTACSGAGRGGPIDACTVIGPQRAEAILGASKVTVEHKGPTPHDASDASLCFYSTGSFGGGFLLIAARPGFHDAQAEARSQIASMRKEKTPAGVPALAVRKVDGPGEAAFVGTMPGSTQLHVLDHGVSVVIAINRSDSPAVRARASKLAQAALDHLKQ